MQAITEIYTGLLKNVTSISSFEFEHPINTLYIYNTIKLGALK